MPQTHIYPADELPHHLRWQISAGVRFQFEYTFREVPHLRWWDGIVVDIPGWSVLVAEGDLLISHAGITHRTLTYGENSFSVYGISEVFAFPSFRGEGFGKQVVQMATDFIHTRDDADFAILFCREHLRDFYALHGWTEVSSRWVCAGDPEAPTFLENRCVFFLVLSDAAHNALQHFENDPFYLGAFFW